MFKCTITPRGTRPTEAARVERGLLWPEPDGVPLPDGVPNGTVRVQAFAFLWVRFEGLFLARFWQIFSSELSFKKPNFRGFFCARDYRQLPLRLWNLRI